MYQSGTFMYQFHVKQPTSLILFDDLLMLSIAEPWNTACPTAARLHSGPLLGKSRISSPEPRLASALCHR